MSSDKRRLIASQGISASPITTTKRRLTSQENPFVGDNRYALLRASAERIAVAMKSGFYLEATTLLESLLTERLEKRVQWLYQHPPTPATSGDLEKLKDGFKTLNALASALKKTEPDPQLRAILDPIITWGKNRNEAIHEMAKLGQNSDKPWYERYASAGETALSGIKLLLELDLHERRTCHANRIRSHASATCPDALKALGQSQCEWCRS